MTKKKESFADLTAHLSLEIRRQGSQNGVRTSGQTTSPRAAAGIDINDRHDERRGGEQGRGEHEDGGGSEEGCDSDDDDYTADISESGTYSSDMSDDGEEEDDDAVEGISVMSSRTLTMLAAVEYSISMDEVDDFIQELAATTQTEYILRQLVRAKTTSGGGRGRPASVLCKMTYECCRGPSHASASKSAAGKSHAHPVIFFLLYCA